MAVQRRKRKNAIATQLATLRYRFFVPCTKDGGKPMKVPRIISFVDVSLLTNERP